MQQLTMTLHWCAVYNYVCMTYAECFILPAAWPCGDWVGAKGPPEHIVCSCCTVAARTREWPCYWACGAGVSRVQLQWMGPSWGGDCGPCRKRPRSSIHSRSESKFHNSPVTNSRRLNTRISFCVHCLRRPILMTSTGPSTNNMGASLFPRTTWKRLSPRLKKCAIFCAMRVSQWGDQSRLIGLWSTRLRILHPQVKHSNVIHMVVFNVFSRVVFAWLICNANYKPNSILSKRFFFLHNFNLLKDCTCSVIMHRSHFCRHVCCYAKRHSVGCWQWDYWGSNGLEVSFLWVPGLQTVDQGVLQKRC